MEYQTSILRGAEEIEIVVDYSVLKPVRGARDRFGAPLEPDEEGGIEIDSITTADGKEFEVTDSELTKIELDIEKDLDDGF